MLTPDTAFKLVQEDSGLHLTTFPVSCSLLSVRLFVVAPTESETLMLIADRTPIEIPAGKILLAEYADVNDDNRALTTIFATTTGKYGRVYRLIESTPGFECAGSVARWTNGYFACRFTDPDGTIHGNRTQTYAEAEALYVEWTGATVEPVAVAA